MSDKSQESSPSSALPSALAAARENRVVHLGAAIVLIVAGAVVGYVLGHTFAASDLAAAQQMSQQLTTQSQGLKQEVAGLKANVGTLQAKLKATQEKLESIMPTDNTYSISPNQSLIVANGRLTIGLIGPPSNEAVTIIINGKQQSVAAGNVVAVALNASTNCQVAVQSFDMFKALITATCNDAKPQ